MTNREGIAAHKALAAFHLSAANSSAFGNLVEHHRYFAELLVGEADRLENLDDIASKLVR
jgi:hypothetical protein